MLKIDLYTEITCPWCLIGLHRLDKVLAERFPNLSTDISHHPVLLLPNEPIEGLYIPDLLLQRYGITDPKSSFARPEAEARISGLNLDLSSQPWTHPTQSAHALISAAHEYGTQHELAVALTKAHFLEAKKISDTNILADIASNHGFDRANAHDIAKDPDKHKSIEIEASKAAAIGIRSVPHFIFNKRISISGARSEDEIATAIEEVI